MSDLTKGVVTEDHDPKGGYRVEVSLPAQRDKKIWCDVATFYASAKGGACFLPETGDEVLVAYLDGDESQAIVVGSLFTQRTPPPAQLHRDGRSHARGFQTSSGAMISFDDEAQTVVVSMGAAAIALTPTGATVSDEAGNSIQLDNVGGRIVSNGDFTLEAAGSITIEAGADLAAEAGKGVEIKADDDVGIEAGKNVGIEADNDVGFEAGKGVSVSAASDIGFNAGANFGVAAAQDVGIDAGIDAKIKAGARAELEGQAGATVEGGSNATLRGGAVTTVAGAIVQIN